MDTIREYTLELKTGEQFITVPKNSQILSVRMASLTDYIIVGVLVDLDTDEITEKCILIFSPHDEILDNMKANFIGVISSTSSNKYTDYVRNIEKPLYVFEKLS